MALVYRMTKIRFTLDFKEDVPSLNVYLEAKTKNDHFKRKIE